MATLDEVSNRLMKPAKDLADWIFPFATVLEEYCTRLNDQDDVNFSNTALVLQNSANVYARRVESLYHDTTSLNQSFAEHEAAEAAKKETKKGAKDKNSLIDFGDFEMIDFKKFVGKNNSLKTRAGINNSVKLLGQRFPQLENSRSSLPIQVYDIHGEIVGKKYDVRCNEYITESGMLVEHLTPKDFPSDSSEGSPNIPTSSAQTENNLNVNLEACQSLAESGVDLVATLEPGQSVLERSENLITSLEETQLVQESGIDTIGSLKSSQTIAEANGAIDEGGLCENDCEQPCMVHEKDTILQDTSLLDTSFASSFDSGLGSSIQCSNVRPESSISNFADCHWEPLESRPRSSLSNIDDSSLVGRNSLPLDCPQDNEASVKDKVQSTEEESGEATQVEDSQLDRCCTVESTENTADDCVPDTDADGTLKSTCQVANAQVRRSKRQKNDVVPDKLPKSRTEFKLPCPIALLKSKGRPRKRKITTGKQRKSSPGSTPITDYGSARKKMLIYSPTRQLFHLFKKEEFEDFQTCIEERSKNLNLLDYEAVEDNSFNLLGFRAKFQKVDREARNESGINTFLMTDTSFEKRFNKRPKIDASNYKAVTNISMELLGFTTSISKSDPVTAGFVSSIIEPTENIESMESVVEDFPMPDTPESTEMSPPSPPSPPSRLRTHHSRIEQYVRDIYNSADVRPAQEEAGERRPPFDVKQYSARVIEKIKAKDDGKIEFQEMVDQQELTEVVRYFSVSLELASKYNLHIETSSNVEGNLTLVLLDKDR